MPRSSSCALTGMLPLHTIGPSPSGLLTTVKVFSVQQALTADINASDPGSRDAMPAQWRRIWLAR
jgi:hypothetical protein